MPHVNTLHTNILITGTVVINFDEIGFKENIPIPGSQGRLSCLVKSIGATKSLIISPDECTMIRELTYSTELMGKQLLCLREVTDGLQVSNFTINCI